MINNETMYSFYKEALSDKGRAILGSCLMSSIEEDLMVELFNDIKTFHPEHSNKSSILALNAKQIKELRVSPHQKLFISNYIDTINTMKENKKKAAEVSKLLINQGQFSFILITFNRLLWTALIEKSYKFKHKLIGSFYVVCRENPICKPKMKWKESLSNKQAIIDRGGIPRVELEARKAEFNNEEYKGEEWIERHDPFNLAIKWRRSSYANLLLPSIKDFNMKLVRTGRDVGVIDALKEKRDNNKLEDLLIKYITYE